jgi:outer membrane protein TolC
VKLDLASTNAPQVKADARIRIASARTAAPDQIDARPPRAAGPQSGVPPASSARAEQVPSPPVIPPPAGEYPLDLATALRLADFANPTIGKARTAILEALGLQLAARTLLVPSLNTGVSYHGHNGALQRSAGRILLLSQQSLYIGAGARTATAESMTIPGVSILTPLADAWFEPLAARQRLAGARFSASAIENEILMDVAVLHLELIGSQAILEADRLSEQQAFEITRITRAFEDTGQGRKADSDRAQAEWRYRRADVQKAEEGLGVAAARLANRLNLDPAVRLRAVGGPLAPIDLIALETAPEELIQVALANRPDLAARSAQIAEAEAFKNEEIARPLIPTLWVGFSGGVFGGGSNLVPPLVGNFAGRTDFDIRLWWTLLDLGAGNLALIRQRDAQLGQAVARRARTLNRARSEVIAALADARASRNQIDLARRELASARDGFHEDLDRIRLMGAAETGQIRPIEVMNSLNLLARARASLVRVLVLYNQAQFRLWVALGSPPPLVEAPAPGPAEAPTPDYLRP